LVDLRLDDPRLDDLIFQPGARNRGLRSPTYRAGKAVTNPCAMLPAVKYLAGFDHGQEFVVARHETA
jgi:hypothetical protein